MNSSDVREERQRLLRSFIVPIGFVVLIWIVKCVEVVFNLDFSFLGIKPLQTDGIPGIVLFHFLHGSWSHLYANTLPIIVLGACLYYFYRPIATKICLLLMFSTGLLTWCGARGGVHIGASALIYGLAFFLMLSGFIRRNKSLVIVSFLVIFLYGSLVWGLYPKYAIDNHISWEGHLAGFIMGIAFAIVYRNEGPQREENDDDADDSDSSDDSDNYWDVPEPPKEELTQPRYFRH
jgi:membrane associated rhomboid family serine protease